MFWPVQIVAPFVPAEVHLGPLVVFCAFWNAWWNLQMLRLQDALRYDSPASHISCRDGFCCDDGDDEFKEQIGGGAVDCIGNRLCIIVCSLFSETFAIRIQQLDNRSWNVVSNRVMGHFESFCMANI